MSATNLPWTRNEYGEVLGANGRTVELNGFASIVSPGVRQDEAKANAVAVILAVNSHDELVAALSACQWALQQAQEDLATFEAGTRVKRSVSTSSAITAALSRIPDIQIKGAA